MPNVLVHRATELRPQTRAAVEAELGRSLADDEQVSIMAFVPHEAPAGEARQDAVRRLKEHLSQVDQKLQGIPGQEIEEALNEALQAVRPAYRERE